MIGVALRCHGCAATVDPLDPATGFIAGCPNARRAPEVDHVLVWDPVAAGLVDWPADNAINPFLRYRTLQHWYWLGRARGMSDDDLVAAVTRIDRAVASVDGSGFVITPFDRDDAASDALGCDLWVKDETGNVAGSHKARHLMGLALHMDITRVGTRTRLAIASCGNAALGAATIAKAVRRPLDVFVPPSANPFVLDRLRALGATITTCTRRPDDPPGDPCFHRFQEAVRAGALPFCCQGPSNGLTIDGGTTIGYELATQLSLLGSVAPARLFVQVGGGALASAIGRGLDVARRLGVLDRVPALHCVQTEGAAPLHRAWRRVAERALAAIGTPDPTAGTDAEAAARLCRLESAEAADGALSFAATHRSRHMWPWEEEPSSIATGILDDETYDWFELVRTMLVTGGWPIVVTESQVVRANELMSANADHTGSAGLAGVVAMRRNGLIGEGERVVALATGVRRS